MGKYKYFFQKRKTNFTKRFFEKGLCISSALLFTLKESGKLFLDELPNSYPAFKLLKDVFEVVPPWLGDKKKIDRKEILTNLSRLEKQGLIVREPKKKFYVLTGKGQELVCYIKDRYAVLNKPWDGNFRVVIFDIPEKKNYHRRWIRDELLLLNFKELQKSVYIGKHPLPKSFYKDMIQFGLNDYIFVFTVNEIDKKEYIIKILEE